MWLVALDLELGDPYTSLIGLCVLVIKFNNAKNFNDDFLL